MDYLDPLLSRLAASDLCGYHPGMPAATEPTALVAMALFAHGRDPSAQRLVDRLLEMQNRDGSVGIDRLQQEPGWPTAWALLAWRAAQKSSVFAVEYVAGIDRALAWILNTEGTLPDHIDDSAGDIVARGWPWVQGTYSWVEPTAMNLLALKHVRQTNHRRAREAALLLDHRLLASGGCNYGNTVVFGQALRPHVEPTGLALLALIGEEDPGGRVARSVEYLQRELSGGTPAASLSYGVLGLAAQDALPPAADDWLQAAAQRSLERRAPTYKLALLALAALGRQCPLITAARLPARLRQPNLLP